MSIKTKRCLAAMAAGLLLLSAGCAEPASSPESTEASAAQQDLVLGRYKGIVTVSYTHLDVYKRPSLRRSRSR